MFDDVCNNLKPIELASFCLMLCYIYSPKLIWISINLVTDHYENGNANIRVREIVMKYIYSLVGEKFDTVQCV